ncbi:MAG: hypothetical protein H7Z18_03005 [Methylophilaceae bacterium]|nr:hypothetical protein [Methylophilaceae bacterium]
MNLYPVTVVENFYDNPDAIRKFALGQKYEFLEDRKDSQYVFPGCRTKDIYDLDAKLHEKICKKLVSIFHIHEHDLMRWTISTSFQSVTEDYGKGVIHTDSNTIFAGVLYLTPNAPLNSGTSLYKKGATFDAKKYQASLEKNDDSFRVGEKILSTDYHSMFDEVVKVNNVYNTLIIYEGDTLHAANQFFGGTLKDSRLAQVFFINKIDANKANSFPLNRVKGIKI